jgi:hypothetical protein
MPRIGVGAIIGLVLAGIGIVSPIVWEIYKTKSAIELQHLSTAILVEESNVEKLAILYAGKRIRSVSRFEFAIVNTGRTPIVSSEIMAKPQLKFSEGIEILEFRTEGRSPLNLDFQSTIDSSKRTLEIGFPLLNTSDFIRFSVIVGGSNPQFTAATRIKGINQLTVSDRRKQVSEKSTTTSTTESLYVGLFWIGVAFFMSFVFGKDAVKERRVYERLRSNTLFPPAEATKTQYLDFLNQTFAYRIQGEIRPIKGMIGALEDGPFSQEARAAADGAVKELLKQKDAGLALMIIFGVSGTIGLGYLVWSLF